MGLLQQAAENETLDLELRKQAIFWIGDEGGEGALPFLTELHSRLTNDELKRQVLFAVSETDSDGGAEWLLARAEDALTAAVLADSPDPWRRLLALARDTGLDEKVREQAIFWLGQSAAREATRGLAEVVDGDETTALQKAAVFALSRRDEPERVDHLLRVARTHANPEVVEAALFWLADSEDERVLDLFEEILLAAEASTDR